MISNYGMLIGFIKNFDEFVDVGSGTPFKGPLNPYIEKACEHNKNESNNFKLGNADWSHQDLG